MDRHKLPFESRRQSRVYNGSGRHSQICAGDIRHVGYGIHCCKNKEVNYDTSTIKAAIGFYLEYPDIDMDSISFDFRNSDGTVDAHLYTAIL